ncbi:hypothetical protein KP509_23G002400 [Ceratopteris richardii]|nr:hypothetical protein KP509_23G002400 [Ceratopteris richardii]
MDIVGNETWMIPDRNPAYKVLCSPIDTCASESMASHAFSSPDVYQWKLPLLEQEPETSVSNSQVDQSLKHKEIRRSLEQSLLVCKSGREPINKAASTPTPKKKNTVDSGSSRKRNAGSRNGQCDHQKTSSKKGDGEDMVDVSGMAEDGDQGTRKKTRQQTSSKLPHKDLEMTTETNPDVGQSLGIYPAITSMDRSEEVLIDASSARAEISKAGIASVGEEGGERTAHISVERNRRKQMNEHLAILRSLMPSSYVQRSDQASVIGGVIEFIKELQQLLTSLETQKRRRTYVMESINPRMANKGSIPHGNVIDQLNLQGVKQELVASSRSEFADVEVKLAGGCEVLLRALCHKVERGQLQHLIAALECLSLQILHLNITTVQQSILYTFTLKIGIDCQLSVDDLAAVGQQIFKEIHGRSI